MLGPGGKNIDGQTPGNAASAKTGRRSLLRWRHAMLALACAGAAPVLAQTGGPGTYWTSPTSGDWFNSARWSNGVPQSGTSVAMINVPGNGYSITLGQNVLVGGVNLVSPGATLAQSGGALSLADGGAMLVGSESTMLLGGNLAAVSGGSASMTNAGSIIIGATGQSIGQGLSLYNSGTLRASVGTSLTTSFRGAITNTGLIRSDAGMSMVFQGGMVNAGALRANGNMVFGGVSSASAVRYDFDYGTTFEGGGELEFTRDADLWEPVMFDGSVLIHSVDRSPMVRFHSSVTAPVTVWGQNYRAYAIFDGSVLAPADQNIVIKGMGSALFNGQVYGTVLLRDNAEVMFGQYRYSPVHLRGGGTLRLTGQQRTGSSLIGGDWWFEPGTTTSIDGGSFVSSYASVTLQGPTSRPKGLEYLTINGGWLSLLDGREFDFAPAGNVFVNSGTLERDGVGTTTVIPSSITLNNTGMVRVSGGSMKISGPITQVSGSTLTGGAWEVGWGAALEIDSAISTIGQDARVSLGGTFSAINGLLTNAGTLELWEGRSFTTVGALGNAGTITLWPGSVLTASGGLELGGAGSTIYLGEHSTAPARLVLGSNVKASGLAGQASIQSIVMGGVEAGPPALNASGYGELDLGGATRVFDVEDGPAAVDLSIRAHIVNGGIIKEGNGTMLLGVPNGYAGPTRVSAGVLQLGASGALPSATDVTLQAETVLDLAGYSNTVGSLAGSGLVRLGGATLTVGANDNTTFFSGNITETGGLRKIGAGAFTVTGEQSFLGGVDVLGGTLRLLAPNSFRGDVAVIGSDSLLLVGGNSHLGHADNAMLLRSGGTLQTAGSMTMPRMITIGPGGGTIRVNNDTTLTLTEKLDGSAPLTKAGRGTLDIQATMPFSGSVTVAEGKLSLSGVNGSLVSVPSFKLETGGTLEFDNTLGDFDRADHRAQVTLRGGTLRLIGSESDATTQQLGLLIPEAGHSKIQIFSGAKGGVASFVFDGLGTRGAGATLDFSANDPGNSQRVFVGGLSEGFMGSWATVNGASFARYDSKAGVVPLALAEYSTNVFPESGNSGTSHVRLDPLVTNPPVPTTVGTSSMRTLTIDTLKGVINVAQNNGTMLTLRDGGLIKSGSNVATISGGTITALTTDLNFVVADGTLNIGSRLTGDFVMAKHGGGTLQLSGALSSSFAGFSMVSGRLELLKTDGAVAIPGDLSVLGGVVFSGGSEQIANSAAVSLLGGVFDLNGRTETIRALSNSGGTFLFHGGTLNVGDIELTGGNTVVASELYGSTKLTVSGGVNEVFGLVDIGAGGIQFTGNSSPSILVYASNATPGTLKSGGDIKFDGATGTAGIYNTGDGTNPGILDLKGATRLATVLNAAATLEISTSIKNGGLSKNGAGKLVLSGANALNSVALSAGVLEVQGPSALKGASGAAAISVPSSDAATKLVLRGDGATVNFASDLTLAADLKIETNTLPGSVTALGTMQLGRLSVGGSRLTLLNGTVSFAGTGTTAVSLAGGETKFAPAGGSSLVISGAMVQGAPTAKVTLDGLGTLTLGGTTANAFSGETRVQAGRLELAKPLGVAAIPGALTMVGGEVRWLNSNQMQPTAAVNLSNDASLLNLNGFDQTVGDITMTGGTLATSNGTTAGTLTLGGSVTTSGGLLSRMQGRVSLGDGSVVRVFNVNNGSASGGLEISAQLVGAGGLTKNGAGILSLLNAGNTFTGTITVNGGVLQVYSEGALGAAGNPIVLAGGSLQSLASAELDGIVSLTGAKDAWVDVAPAATLRLNATVGGARGLIKIGTGVLELTATSNFGGLGTSITINGGTLTVGADAHLGHASNAVSIDGGTLHASQSFTSARFVSIGSAGGTIDVPAATVLTLANLNMGTSSANFSKTGGGELTVTGPLSNIGAITITGGLLTSTLHLNGAVAQVSGTTLTSGTWNILEGGVLDMASAPPLTINAANVTFSGATSSFARFNSVNENNGVLTFANGRGFAASSFTNRGTLELGTGCTLTVSSKLDQQGFVQGLGRVALAGGATLAAQSGSITRLAQNVGSPVSRGGSIDVGAGAVVEIGATQHLVSLAVAGSAQIKVMDGVVGSGSSVINTQSLTMTPGGSLDLGDGAVVIDYTSGDPSAAVRAAIISGRNGGLWNGAGIRSATAAALPIDRAVGYALAPAIGMNGKTMMGEAIDDTSLIIRLTVKGDATLDGIVNFDDLVAVAQNYESGPGKVWHLGDFNYDGAVTFDDLVDVAQHYETSLPGGLGASIPGAPADFSADWALAQQVAVPEPGISAMMLAGLSVLGRRRRRRTS